MLVISRKVGTAVETNGPCRVTILGVCGERVKVGVEADEDVQIIRSELVPLPETERDGGE